ncbi:uncharacterized protein LOC132037723 isoform X1 [Lycium ferocissimum]|uniref:uncharacterized protein LOC132037723 isoform X1 n=1 Tax=Lycium ferocissimum TaxID=112874 RepID=UPI0028163D61|nr:uncharacterized protein LOC132037723 isoform X1 [Lycium ferocissimum]
MPGTIQVSVFDFKNTSSSAPSSSICLWVSMGKRAYQTWDKGDFSFPLTTFRENLVVRLQDAEGNEISRTEVKTLSIVEKGYWDDFFQLEGGDYVHMKLQFTLSEDERNRIRNVRESALRKKLKVPATNIEYKGTAIPVRASSLAIRKEFSDRSEANSSSPVKEGVEIQYSEPDRPSAKKLQTQLIPVYEQDAQSILKLDVTGKKQSVSRKKIADPSNNPEDQSAQSMLKMDVAANKESVSQKKIVDPSNKSEDQSEQSLLKMDVAAKKEFVSQEKIVDPSNKPEDQSVQSMLKMDVAARKAFVSQEKIVDPSNKPEVQSVQSMLKMDVAAKKGFVSQEKIVDPSNNPEDQSAQSMFKMDVAARKALVSQEKIDPSNKPEDQSVQSMLKMDVVAKKEFVSQDKIVDPSNKPEDQSAESMFKMDVAEKKEFVSQKKIVDPSNKPEDQSAQSMLKMDVAAKKEFVSQEKIVDPSNKPEDQSVQFMLKMDVAAKKEFVSQKKIVDPFNKPEDQSAQSMLKMDVAAKKEPVSQMKIVDPSNKPEGQSAQSMLKMDVAANNESISQKKNVDPSNKSEDQDAQSMLKMDVAAKKESVSQKKNAESSNKPEDQGVLEKTTSSVRKMISAFETGLTQKKGRRSLTRNRASKSQPNLVGIGGSLRDLDPEDTARPNEMSALRLERPLNTVDFPEPQINIGKRGDSSFPAQAFVGMEEPVFHEQLEHSNVHIVQVNETGSSQQETLRSAKKESTTEATSPVYRMRGESSSHEQDIVGAGLPMFHEQLKQPSMHIAPFNEAGSSQQETFGSATKESNTVAASPVGLMRLSNLQTVTSSQTTNVAHPDMLKANDLAADQDRLNGPSVAEKRNREVRSETLPEVHFERASNVKPKLVAFCENELYDSENSGAWIFPANKKRQCIKTAGENIVHLSEDFSIGVDDHQSNERPSMQEITGKHGFFHIIDSMTKKGREKPQKPRNQSESSGENGSSGPVRQVIKIALIVGFGILVLLTRQRDTRRNDRKSKEFYNTSPDFMDHLASSEEQWSLTVEGD